ncbi:cupin [bacterium (Candidatus Blackallbacteria) CG17_big_fil_post_rev_8_21_14_2_50_48_46]|uniref:Cupin n=1 Tax=bacterium (Candidatus Blackallbacteria) CG17_big_fil_post_rev_8_21_14_2_50_48_46 TaxID=2014261 RepID=A0A2M7G0L9_9BACT|nr:MAG: cupin [bacterium (Candidatus Blackallbacteria) CG18_big_fil_WC_8_21_14_2_50_49_26]PIW14772.1 MAG: cupin [bacterium (Candidatus Blackallbacteria) CG17_big_fil_post_rev_8_21_14_2_50_48_46]PIW50874.1 MAG: cupin [bacterium (Candidatus Blackallbacteria) CG13_big_fil_rev_8_21_14_2_50_49_14]
MSENQSLPPIVNLKDIEFTLQQQGDHYHAQFAQLGQKLGSQKLGSQLVILPPGKKAWPLHAHYVNEELFFILAGEGLLRLGEKEYLLTSGDLISIPPGPEYAHQIINTGSEDMTYLAVSTMEAPDIIVYPDSQKINVVAGSPPGGDPHKRNLNYIGHLEQQVEYWDGE